jgi:pSer/pThr/pTyr-binding forkhead associated (FHA) protein
MENEPIFTYCLNCGKPLEQSMAGFKPTRGPVTGDSGCVLVSIRADGGPGPEHPLKDGVNTLGRLGPEVSIPDDPRVADRHATLEVGRDVVFLEDLGTRHGTFVRVNGQRAVVDGDQVRIGHALFAVQVGIPRPQPTTDGAAWLGTAGTTSDHFGRLLRLGPSDVVIEGHLLRAPETTLGRTSGDIVLPDDPFVSSRHAAFQWAGTGCVLKDAGSTNGCYVRIRGRTAVQSGDSVLLGHHLFQFKRAK